MKSAKQRRREAIKQADAHVGALYKCEGNWYFQSADWEGAPTMITMAPTYLEAQKLRTHIRNGYAKRYFQ